MALGFGMGVSAQNGCQTQVAWVWRGSLRPMMLGSDMVPNLWRLGLAWMFGLSVIARLKTLGPDMIARSKYLESGVQDLHNFCEPGKDYGFVEEQNTHANVLNGLKTSN